MTSSENVTSINFEELFGNNQTLSFERVEAFLSKIIQMASEQAKTNPNQLVRVVTNDNVTWMTQEQAVQFLENNNTSAVKQDIEHALKGNLHLLRQELEVLAAIAFYTLDQYEKKSMVSQNEISEIRPQLKRRQIELNTGVKETAESEALLNDKRKRAPLVDEYEMMMSEFIRLKNQNQLPQAAAVAQKLQTFKKQYVMLTRSMEPDVRTIYSHRVNLQKTKKRILSTQRNMCEVRQNQITVELTIMKNELVHIQKDTTEAEVEGLNKAVFSLEKQELNAMELKAEVTAREQELSALKHESLIIKMQEEKAQQVVNNIQEQVLGDSDISANINNALQAAQGPKIDTKPTSQPKEKKHGGMHAIKRSVR